MLGGNACLVVIQAVSFPGQKVPVHPLIGTTQAQSAFGQGDVAEGIVCFYTAKEPGTVGHTVVVGGGGFSVALVLLLVAGVLVTDVGGELQSPCQS